MLIPLLTFYARLHSNQQSEFNNGKYGNEIDAIDFNAGRWKYLANSIVGFPNPK